jgi:hypothetical protein
VSDDPTGITPANVDGQRKQVGRKLSADNLRDDSRDAHKSVDG